MQEDLFQTGTVYGSNLPRMIGCGITEAGAIAVDEIGKTRIPCVYSAGDSASRLHQAIAAASMGTFAAAVCAYDEIFLIGHHTSDVYARHPHGNDIQTLFNLPRRRSHRADNQHRACHQPAQTAVLNQLPSHLHPHGTAILNTPEQVSGGNRQWTRRLYPGSASSLHSNSVSFSVKRNGQCMSRR